jgi:hypothetical protein
VPSGVPGEQEKGDEQSGATLLSASPVEHQHFTLQRHQQLVGNCLYLLHLGVVRIRLWSHEEVIYSELFLAQVLRRRPLLLLGELLREGEQLVEEEFHILRAGVVFFNHLEEFLQIVGTGALQSDHLFELPPDHGLQALHLGALVVAAELLAQKVEVDLTEVDPS